MTQNDASVIRRDYAVDALANYAATNQGAAESTYPLLKEALTVWNGKQAGHALRGWQMKRCSCLLCTANCA